MTLERPDALDYSSDFSQWVALVNNIPTLASRLNGLSIANVAASSHSYDLEATVPPQLTALCDLIERSWQFRKRRCL